MTDDTLTTLVARATPSDLAIGAPGRAGLSYGALAALTDEIRGALGAVGVTARDRVALVLPNGPAMASCFYAVAASAAAAPLNPAYREQEFEFYLSDLEPRVLIVDRTLDSPARDVARRLGVRVVELDEQAEGGAGRFALDAGASGAAPALPAAEDVALVLHTSGTTSRPKIVPLTHRNLCASARHIGATLALTPADHCMNVMPLFHIHGLVAAVLSSLAAGARVSCTPGFSATAFFGWLDELEPSWYTAVPTMHQMILERAARNPESLARASLRFVRSSSASLPPSVMGALEEAFGCPVIESYGMTEAAHQMTSNPLPPAPRKAGSVGIAAGPDVRLMDADGAFVTAGEGEIVIKGPNVTPGYANNPDANAAAFPAAADGGRWFRTGDLGVFDEDGYLSISGRIKEIINRGGEKIAPREVDEVLMEHDAVAQAVTFARAHPKLGEEVAAAVVLRAGAELSERELRDFAAARLAAFKVPRTIHFVPEIPKGPTGKLQRIGLAAQLGLD